MFGKKHQKKIVDKKRDRAVQKLDKLIVETFKQRIEIMSRKDKTMQQRVLSFFGARLPKIRKWGRKMQGNR